MTEKAEGLKADYIIAYLIGYFQACSDAGDKRPVFTIEFIEAILQNQLPRLLTHPSHEPEKASP